MKQLTKRSLGVLLILSLLLGAVLTPASALSGYHMSAEEWQTYWQNEETAGAYVYLAPGADESEMNFQWMGDTAIEDPTVFIKKTSESDYTAFTGVTVSTDACPASYHVTASGLQPDTDYVYYCSADGQNTPVYTFRTASADSFRAVFVSDIHVEKSTEDAACLMNSSYQFHSILDEAVTRAADASLVVSAGDQANSGLLEEYQGVFASPLMKALPLATTCGNHDKKGVVYPDVTNNPNRYNASAVSPDLRGGDYWFVKGDVLFLMLNTNWISAGDHYTFVQNAVNANPDVKWRVAVMHHDLFGGHIAHRESENQALRAMMVPIFDEFRVDLVLMGHSHVYSRTNVVYDSKTVENLAGKNSVTDAAGTIYLTSGSTRRPRDGADGVGSQVAFDHVSSEDMIYNILSFTEDSITVESFASGKTEAVDTFTIEKTDPQGGHPAEKHDVSYDVIGTATSIAAIFQKLAEIFEMLLASIGITL